MKRITCLILVIAFTMCLVACGSNNNTNGNKNEYEWEQLEWPKYDNAKQIPLPKSTTVDIRNCHDIRFEFYVANTTLEDYKSYVEECKSKGFTIDVVEQEKEYFALNEGKYELTVKYLDGDIMYIEVVEYRCEVEIKLLHTSKKSADSYDIRIEIDDRWEDDGEKGKEAVTFDALLKEGKHTLLVENDDDDDINGRIDFIVTEDGEYFEFEITCSSSKVDIKKISKTDNTTDTSSQETTAPPTSSNNDTAESKNTYISNGIFTYTARDFMKRFDEYELDGANYLWARKDGEKLYYEIADVDNGYRSVGMVGFDNANGKILTIDDDFTNNVIAKINVLVEDANDVPPILVSCMCATDPTLNVSSAFNIGQDIVETAGTETGYTHNNIKYVIAADGDYYYIIITPAMK